LEQLKVLLKVFILLLRHAAVIFHVEIV